MPKKMIYLYPNSEMRRHVDAAFSTYPPELFKILWTESVVMARKLMESRSPSILLLSDVLSLFGGEPAHVLVQENLQREEPLPLFVLTAKPELPHWEPVPAENKLGAEDFKKNPDLLLAMLVNVLPQLTDSSEE